jgi:hypothetical protein
MRKPDVLPGILLLALAPSLYALVPGCVHVTNGSFGPGEWTCPTVAKNTFPQVGGAGGSTLYVDQGGNNLYLMYDYFGGGLSPATFFDVFFEVVPDNTDYLARITGTTIQAFERPLLSPAPVLPNGSFNISPGSGWTPLTSQDLQLANFIGAVGFGVSPDSATPHPMAEFQLTINRPGSPGIYSPAPAFWGASVKPSGGADPPISSAIFQLNPDGSTILIPVLGGNGAPVMQGTATPEPGSLNALASGVLLLALRRRRS